MAGQANGGQVTKPHNPMDMGRYVGNPNHIAQTQTVRNPNNPMYVPPTSNGLMTGGANDLRDSMKPFLDAQGKLVAEPTPTISQTRGLQGMRDENGNLIPSGINNRITPLPSLPQSNLGIGAQPRPNINVMAADAITKAGQVSADETGYTPTQVTANQLATTNLSPYTNPYDDAVVKATQDDMLRSNMINRNQLGASASMANAFGGSRHGIAMSENDRNMTEQMARATAGLRQAGFQNAQNQAQYDINNNLQAQLANQSANQSGSAQRLNAANQLGNVANLGFNMGQTVNSNLGSQGAMQQALQQAIMTAGQNKFAGYTGHPSQGIGYLTQALGVPALSNVGTQTTTQNKGLFDYLTLGASLL